MNRIVLILAFVVYCSASSFAMWAYLPLEDLVQQSDVIVIGTLERVSQYTQNGVDYAQGTILIDEVVWGPVSTGESLTLQWRNQSNVVCPRVEHRQNEGNKGIWLLTVEPNGVFSANYPGRFVDLLEKSKVKDYLAKSVVRLRPNMIFHADGPIIISLVLRNPSDRTIVFPGIEFRNGTLLTAPEVSLSIYTGYAGDQESMPPLAGRLLKSRELTPILVPARQEMRLDFNLRDIFTINSGRNYSLQVRVKGYGKPSGIGIYSRESAQQVSTSTSEETPVHSRTPISRLALLMPSIVAILVSSTFVYRHAVEMRASLQKR